MTPKKLSFLTNSNEQSDRFQWLTVPNKHVLSLMAPQHPKNPNTSITAPATMNTTGPTKNGISNVKPCYECFLLKMGHFTCNLGTVLESSILPSRVLWNAYFYPPFYPIVPFLHLKFKLSNVSLKYRVDGYLLFENSNILSHCRIVRQQTCISSMKYKRTISVVTWHHNQKGYLNRISLCRHRTMRSDQSATRFRFRTLLPLRTAGWNHNKNRTG